MRIGLDLRVLQDPRRRPEPEAMVRAACREVALRLADTDELVALIDPAAADPTSATELFPEGARPRIVRYPEPSLRRLRKLLSAVSPEREAILTREVDVLCQFDPDLGVPAATPTVLVVHDLAALRFGDRHPDLHRPRYRAARRAGMGVGGAAYRAATRRLHERNLLAALQRAATVVTVSEHTASLLGALMPEGSEAGRRITTVTPGADPHDRSRSGVELNALERNRITGLGLDQLPFLFFSGASHDGARIADLVAAFNDLRAGGRELALVLVGSDLQTTESMIDRTAARAVATSSYREDVHLLGTIRPELTRWLSSHAAVTVVPGEVAGSGSVLIAAALSGSPVVATDHPSIREHAAPGARLVSPRWEDLSASIAEVLDRPPASLQPTIESDRRWAAERDWSELGEVLIDSLRAAVPTGS